MKMSKRAESEKLSPAAQEKFDAKLIGVIEHARSIGFKFPKDGYIDDTHQGKPSKKEYGKYADQVICYISASQYGVTTDIEVSFYVSLESDLYRSVVDVEKYIPVSRFMKMTKGDVEYMIKTVNTSIEKIRALDRQLNDTENDALKAITRTIAGRR